MFQLNNFEGLKVVEFLAITNSNTVFLLFCTPSLTFEPQVCKRLVASLVPTLLYSLFLTLMAPMCYAHPDAPAPAVSPLQDWSDSVGAAASARNMTPPRPEPPSVVHARMAGDRVAAGGRIAALERSFAPEKEARVAALHKEERRKDVLHRLQVRLLKGQLRRNALELEQLKRRNQLELELLELEKELKIKQVAALGCQPQE